MGNVQFIDLVGSCFSAMNAVEEQFNDWVKGVVEAKKEIAANPDQHEGCNNAMKCMRSDRVRAALAAIHNRRCWLEYAAATLRFYNQKNMKAIGITEQEVTEYTNDREKKAEDSTLTPPNANDYYTDAIAPDKLTSMGSLNARIEELKTEQGAED